MNALTPTRKISQNPHVNQTIIDHELIIMGPVDHVSYRVNPVGAFLWSLLGDTALTISDMAKHLQQRYQLADERAMQDVSAFVEMMMSKKILVAVDVASGMPS